MKAVFRSNLKKQSSMVLVREVPLPQGHACKSTSYQCSGLMGRIPVQTWSFVGVLSEATKMGFIVTFVSSEWVIGRREWGVVMCLTSLIRSRCMCGNRFWLSLFRAFIAICVCLFGNESRMWRKYSFSFSLCLFCECVGFCYTSSLHQKYIGSSRLFIILVDSLIHWFIDSLIHWLIDSSTHRFIDSSTHWLIDSSTHHV